MPCYLYRCTCPLGRLVLASDGAALTGLWFAGQKHFAASLPAGAADAARQLAEAPDTAPALLSLPDTTPAAGPAISGTAFPAGAPDSQAPRTGGTAAFAAPDALPAIFRQTEAWLAVYFAGRDPGAPPPLRPAGTPFQRAVWAALCRIPYGRTTSYGALARQLAEGPRRPGARAVGSAVGRNPISILIPCHRVLAADGRLTGYAGGLDRKSALLALEGIAVR